MTTPPSRGTGMLLAGLSLAFTLVVLRSADEDQARRLSSAGQLVGYGGGAPAPVVVGSLFLAGRPGTLSERTGRAAPPGWSPAAPR